MAWVSRPPPSDVPNGAASVSAMANGAWRTAVAIRWALIAGSTTACNVYDDELLSQARGRRDSAPARDASVTSGNETPPDAGDGDGDSSDGDGDSSDGGADDADEADDAFDEGSDARDAAVDDDDAPDDRPANGDASDDAGPRGAGTDDEDPVAGDGDPSSDDGLGSFDAGPSACDGGTGDSECACGGSRADGDGDGTPDCEDPCPEDPDKAVPGACGCGFPDTANLEGSLFCQALADTLSHRYPFNGNADDAVGDADGTVVGGSLGPTAVTLAGGSSDEHVDLPNDVLNGLTDVTVEAWVTWGGGEPWQRIFDFGSSDGGEGEQGVGLTGFFLVPSASPFNTGLRAELASSEPYSSTIAGAAEDLPLGVVTHVAVVLDDSGDQLSLYQDGQLVATSMMENSLRDIAPVNNWLGRSQHAIDDDFEGTYHEFRIYSAALSAEAIEYSFELGPDAVPLQLE